MTTGIRKMNLGRVCAVSQTSKTNFARLSRREDRMPGKMPIAASTRTQNVVIQAVIIARSRHPEMAIDPKYSSHTCVDLHFPTIQTKPAQNAKTELNGSQI